MAAYSHREDPAGVVLGLVAGYPAGQVGGSVVSDLFGCGRIEYPQATRAFGFRGDHHDHVLIVPRTHDSYGRS
ncbi:hypothetical protein ACFQ1S_23910 [Kibdelosporangium lantanae]|uniref:Uncharacterized protein n=1 Tax=Kibdelosporangium lantanae TaxID=1497396 RepID=A0ABW3MC66_9PSEU